MNRMPTKRVSVTTAARNGVSWLNDTAVEGRVVLTKFGRAASVIDSAERLDDDLARLRGAADAVLSAAADNVAGRTSFNSLNDVCADLGLDPDAVRARSAELADASE